MGFIVKKYRLITGIVISLFITLLAFVPRYIQSDGDQVLLLVLNLFAIFLFCLLSWFINQKLIHSNHFPEGIGGQLIRMFISFVISVVLTFVIVYLFHSDNGTHYFYSYINFTNRKRLIGGLLFRGMFVNSFLYFICYIFYLNYKNQHIQLENEKLKHENLEARLFVLKQQLSPHFLFNSLGVLHTMTDDNNAGRYILQLSNIYRYLLNSTDLHLSPLAKEIDFIESYLYILKERFEDALQVTITIDEKDAVKQIAPLALQLLIENAVKHNVVSADEPLQITIFTEDDYVCVNNNINPKLSGNEGNGVGLSNISERYRLLFKKDIVILNANGLFTVKLPLI